MCEPRIEGALVAWDGEGRFEVPAPSVADPRVESAVKFELAGVAEAAGLRVEASVESQTNGGAVASDVRNGQIPNEAVLDAADASIRSIDSPRDIDLTQTPGQAGFSELRAKLSLQPPSCDRGLVASAHAVRHDQMIPPCPLSGDAYGLTLSVRNRELPKDRVALVAAAYAGRKPTPRNRPQRRDWADRKSLLGR